MTEEERVRFGFLLRKIQMTEEERVRFGQGIVIGFLIGMFLGYFILGDLIGIL